MTGRRELFTDLDGDVSGSVRFGDASRVDIQGVGTIAFEGKNGERWLLHGVFYIPALKNSIMSLGRLDKDGSEVRIQDGVLRVWDQRGRLLIKVLRGPNFLYTHHFTTAKPRRPEQAEDQRQTRSSASPCARMIKRGCGMSATVISTSTPCTSSARTTWCAGCR